MEPSHSSVLDLWNVPRHLSSDGQNDAAELLCSELPNEDASQKHSDICCVVECCYCSVLWRWICYAEGIKRGIEALTTSRSETRDRESNDSTQSHIVENPLERLSHNTSKGFHLIPSLLKETLHVQFCTQHFHFPLFYFHLTTVRLIKIFSNCKPDILSWLNSEVDSK